MRQSDGITDNGHEFEQASGDREGQGSLACCSPWGHKESDTTDQQQNNLLSSNILYGILILFVLFPEI